MLTVDAVNVAPEPPRLTTKAVGASPAIIERPTAVWLFVERRVGSKCNNEGHLNTSEGTKCSNTFTSRDSE